MNGSLRVDMMATSPADDDREDGPMTDFERAMIEKDEREEAAERDAVARQIALHTAAEHTTTSGDAKSVLAAARLYHAFLTGNEPLACVAELKPV